MVVLSLAVNYSKPSPVIIIDHYSALCHDQNELYVLDFNPAGDDLVEFHQVLPQVVILEWQNGLWSVEIHP